MNPLVYIIIGYALISMKGREEEEGGTWEDREFLLAPTPPDPVVDWSYVSRKKPPPATQDKSKRPLSIEGAWAYGWLYVYIVAAGGAQLWKDPLIKKYLTDYDFTSNDILDFSATTLATYSSVRTMTGSIPLLSDVIGAAAGLIHGFVQFAQTAFDRDSQVRDLFEVWKKAFFGPLGRPPMALFHFMQVFHKELNKGGNTELDPSLIGDLGNPYSPAILLHVRLLKAYKIIERHFILPAKKDVKLAVYGKMTLKNKKEGTERDIFIDYNGLRQSEGMNLWGGNTSLPFPYFFFAFDPKAMFQYVTPKQFMFPHQTEPSEWHLYKGIMSQKTKAEAFSFLPEEFSAVWPKGIAEWRLEVDPTKHTSSGISLPLRDRSRTLRTTKNGWFESRWTP